MKHLIFLIAASFILIKSGNAQDLGPCLITYGYDAAGNRVIRQYQCGHVDMLLVKDSTAADTTQHLTAAIYPNPTAGPVSIVFNNPVNTAQITIADNTGQQLYTTTTGGSTIPINLNNYAQGVYYVTVKTGANTFKSTVVKN